ncbi:MAG: oligosaccharide flippase family protein, partial [Pseudomonadota bacterium]
MNFLKSFGALTGASFFSMAANLVRGKLGALFLGPAGVGIFNQLSLSFNVATLAGSLASNNGLIQHGAEALADDDRDAYARLAGTMTIMLAVASLLLTAIGVALARPLSDLLLADGGAHWREVTVMAVGIPIAVAGALYRGLLGGAQAVKAIVAVQISSEFGGALVFALLVVPFGLTGALVGFLSVHLLGAVAALAALVRRFGWSSIRPRLSAFDR